MSRRHLPFLCLLFVIPLLACGPQSLLKPTATPIPPTATPTDKSTPTPTLTPTSTPTSTSTPLPTDTPTPTPTFTPAATSTPTPTPTPAPPTPNPDVPAGWKEYLQVEDGFSIWLPEDWLVLPLGDEGAQEILETMARANPQFADFLNAQNVEAMSQMFALFALNMDPSSLQDNPMGASLNIAKSQSVEGISMEYFLALAQVQLQSLYPDSEILSSEVTELDGREAGRLVLKAEMTTPLGIKVVAVLMQHYIPVAGDMFVVTVGTAEHLYADAEAEFLEIMETFKILE
jgi:hypothetical protein